jgi:transposase
MNEITEEQYALIRPYLPAQHGNVRVSNLTVANAILFVAENGYKWRALPKRFGKWHTAYTRMRRWTDTGVLDRLFEALQKHHMIRISIDCLGLDSTSIKMRPNGTARPKKRLPSHR